MYACNHCSGKYKTSRSLASHRYSTHPRRSRISNNNNRGIGGGIDSNNLRFEPYPANTLKCVKCIERFPSLTSLFQHKQKYHPGIPMIDPSLRDQLKSNEQSKYGISSPSIEKSTITPIIINHSSHEEEKNDDTPSRLIPMSRSEEYNIPTQLPVTVIDSDPKPIKRRISDTDSEISFDVTLDPPKRKSTSDPHPPKKRRYNNNSDESDYSPDDEDDDEEENNNWNGVRTLNKSERYKSMYQKYRRDSGIWKQRFKRLEAECHTQLNENEELINDHETNCKRRLAEKETLIINLNNEKRDYKDKIKFLQKHIAEFDKDSPRFNNISKALFNCISIGEMNKLRKLFKEKKYSEIYKEENVKIIQKIFIGLNNGVIPICNPQSTVITDAQRDIVERMEDSSTNKAKKLLMENMELIVELFDIVDNSIKMVVDLYYQYGSKDEDDQFDSDVEEQSDDDDQSYDEDEGDLNDSESEDVDDETTDSDSSED